jgi:hypothetical protein
MWLLGRLVPDHKTVADFRKDNGRAIRQVCARFVELCREISLLASASVAIDGSKFKAVNNRDRNVTRAKVERRRAQLEESVARYLSQLDTADRQEPSEALATKTTRLKEQLAKLAEEMRRLDGLEARMLAAPDQQISLTDPDARSMATSGRGSGVVGYNVQVAVDTEHHLIVTHEVTNVGSDRSHLARVAKQAKAALQTDTLEAVTDRARLRRRRRHLQVAVDTEHHLDRGGDCGSPWLTRTGLRRSASVCFFGFLGVGSRLVAVPYDSLKLVDKRLMLPGGTKESLKMQRNSNMLVSNLKAPPTDYRD